MIGKLRRLPLGEVNPFELYLLLAAELQGLTVLLGVAQPTSVRQALSPIPMYVWAALMASGGGAALTGIFWWGDAFTGAQVKIVGLASCAVGSTVYAGAAAILGSAGVAVAVYNVLFAAACITCARQITRSIEKIRRHFAGQRGETGG